MFWLDSRTIGHVVHIDAEASPHEQYDLKALSLEFEDSSDGNPGYLVLSSSLIATLPTLGASDFRYLPQAGRLVFYDQVSKDGYFTMYPSEEEAEQLVEDPPPFFASMFERLDGLDSDSYAVHKLRISVTR